jgi:4-diphosphocytidyl-2-C-methyl-D-erythritol kinase
MSSKAEGGKSCYCLPAVVHGIMSGMQEKRFRIHMNTGKIGPFYARAKINWSLLMEGLREDGYHLLDTVMQRVSLFDEIVMTPATEWSVQCSNARLPANDKNTALLAAKAYAKAAGLTDAYHIYITKNIPVGAGLGGGSADAAAVLIALNERYGALTREELLALGLSIGADVPFCLTGGCARCTGVGEVMEPVQPAGEYHLVIAGCGSSLNTARVFRRYDALLEANRAHEGAALPEFEQQNPPLVCDEPFPWEDETERLTQAPEEHEIPAVCTGDALTKALIAALSSGCAFTVAKSLNAFACRLKTSEGSAVAGGILCDERYVSEADCALCIARAKELLCGANDLTFTACSLAPAVADTLLDLKCAGALAASMSGSGSACFGLFADLESAQKAAKQLSHLPFCAVCSTERVD